MRAQGDSTSHRVEFVSVEKDVRLETLDWGGTGRPVVLLAGLGDGAHVFDRFAPKLTDRYHVYGISRRGVPPSSVPSSGYLADSLADDVLAVIDSLHLDHPVLIGHSQAGEELSSIGSRKAAKISGLIYLDAAYDYAFYDPSHGNMSIDVNEIVRQLEKLRFGSGANPNERRMAMVALADSSLPIFLSRLRGILTESLPPDAPSPPSRAMARVPYAIIAGQQRYAHINGPVLAIFASPPAALPGLEHDPTLGAAIAAGNAAIEAQADAFARGVPQARVVRVPNASHFIFRSNEDEVLRAIHNFIDALPASSPPRPRRHGSADPQTACRYQFLGAAITSLNPSRSRMRKTRVPMISVGSVSNVAPAAFACAAIASMLCGVVN